MSYERLPTTIPMFNDPSDPSSPNHKHNFPSASSSSSATVTPEGQRHRKKSSVAYGYGGYGLGYASSTTGSTNSRPGRSLSPALSARWSLPTSLPMPIPRPVRRLFFSALNYFRRNAVSTNIQSSARRNPRTTAKILLHKRQPAASLVKTIIFIILSAFCLLLYILLVRIYEPHIEIALFSRKFVREEVEPVKPLAGCFSRPSGDYNVSERLYGSRMTDVHAGLQMRFGLDCYEFAGTVNSAFSPPLTTYHTYWRSDLVPFGPRQEYMLKSFFATQNLATSRLILWSNGDLRGNAILSGYLARYGTGEDWAFDVRIVDVAMLARGTELDPELQIERTPPSLTLSQDLISLLADSKAWLDGDLIRLLLLWNYGGVWVDMDFLLTRDLGVLLEHEFVTQWDCYDKKYTPLNGALMHFFARSPYLCEAFHIMATDAPPRPHSTDWGSTLYLKLWRRLVKGGVRPFKILPWCFTDGRSCRLDNRLPDPFKEDVKAGIRWWESQTYEEEPASLHTSQSEATFSSPSFVGSPPPLSHALSQIFGIHLHNQWEKNFPEDGWVERLLLKTYERVLETRIRSHGLGSGQGGVTSEEGVINKRRAIEEQEKDADVEPGI